MEYKLATSIPVDECLDKLKACSENLRLLQQFLQYSSPSYPLSGKPEITFRGKKFKIFIRFEKVFKRNSFHTSFYGEVFASVSGTVIKGTFKMHPFVRAFLTVWFGGAITLGGAVFITSFMQLFESGAATGGKYQGDPLFGVLFFPLFIAFGYGLVKFGKSLCKEEEAHIIKFLMATLCATDATNLLK